MARAPARALTLRAKEKAPSTALAGFVGSGATWRRIAQLLCLKVRAHVITPRRLMHTVLLFREAGKQRPMNASEVLAGRSGPRV